jgi:chromosome segregation ATPase
MSNNTNTAGNRHGAIEETLAGLMASLTDTRNALAEAQRRFAALDATLMDGSKHDQEVGQARRKVKQLTTKLEEQQRQHRKLAQEELAARYALIEDELRRERRTAEELGERETSLAARLTLARGQLAGAETQLNEEQRRGRRLVPGSLRWHVEAAAKEAGTVVKRGGKKVEQLEPELAGVRAERAASTAHLAHLAARREETLALGETYLRELSLEKIHDQLADPHVTVDRGAVEELLAKWARGFTEVEEAPLAAPYRVTYYPRGAGIYYWFHTGEIVATSIFDCPPKTGTGQWSKTSLLTFADVRERLEREQAAKAAEVTS